MEAIKTQQEKSVKMDSVPSKKSSKLLYFGLAFFIFVGVVSYIVTTLQNRVGQMVPPGGKGEKLQVKKFGTNEQFTNFLTKVGLRSSYYGGFAGESLETLNVSPGGQFGAIANTPLDSSMRVTPERVSETNVQVAGIDEPDIVKTDGENIYFSNSFGGVIPLTERSLIEPGIYPPSYNYRTKVIKAFPPDTAENLSEISESGEMLLFNDILVVFSGNKISGYNVSDPMKPVKKWSHELDENNYLMSSRSLEGKLYLVARTFVGSSSPCPLPVMKGSVSVPCTEIYYPNINAQSDSTYTVIIMDPYNGSVENKGTFLGKNGASLVYTSNQAIYVTFTYYESYVNFFIDFLKSDGRGLLPDELIANLTKVASFDISDEAKMVELTHLTENYYAALKQSDRTKLENDIQNKMEDYLETHSRDLEKSGVVRFDTKSLKVGVSEAIPGTPLNQFSLDVYQGNLRIATTTSNNFAGGGNSTNDVYILNSDLRIVGSITDLGLTERIYSARFVEDKGYLVTFRQIDPFYVLDLSDPKNPKKVGELKIPGYSSYLHPISKDKIVGVGQEGPNVKISLFDVSDPANPNEISKYDMSEYWSDVAGNHHAFLLDDAHKVFFMPAGANGYVFTYDGNVINLQRAVTGLQARRALYIDDFLYVLGDEKMVVLNEDTWNEIKTLSF